MKICPKCQLEHEKSGTFCSRKCANSRVWTAADKQKKSLSLKNSSKFQQVLDHLKIIGDKGRVTMKTRGYVERHKSINPLIPKTCPICSQDFTSRKKSKKYCSLGCVKIGNKLRNNTPEAKIRLREIGRMGGFGKKGYTKNGTYYQSSIEKLCFEYLEDNNIIFEAHKPIPHSSKISDVYLPEKDLWVEIDGIDRDKKQKWLEQEYRFWLDKLDVYASNNLNFVVIKSFDEFKKLLDWRIG
jgi:hypothetical protein